MHRFGERAGWLAVLVTLASLAAAAPAVAAHQQHARKQHAQKIHKGLRHVKRAALLGHASGGRIANDRRHPNGLYGRPHYHHHHGDFSLTISPDASTAVGSGQTVTITAKLTNESSWHHLGSADLFAPFVSPPSNPFTVLSASSSTGTASVSSSCPLGRANVPCVELRGAGLAPHASATITMTVQTPPCEQGNRFFWLAIAKRSGNFGNGESGGLLRLDFANSQLRTALDGACKLVFGTSPADALPGAAISGTAGQPLTAEVVDSSGNPVTGSNVPVTMSLATNPSSATLSGTTTVDAANAVATFTDLSINLPGTGYQLEASSGSLTPATSSPFDVSGNTATCAMNASCQVTDTTAAGSVNIVAQAGPGTGVLAEALEAPLTDGQCADYNTLDQNGYVYESTVARGTVVTITIVPRTNLKAPRAVVLASQQLCFGATQDFLDNIGQNAPAATLPNGQPGFVGLLPNCTETSTGPCHDRGADTTVTDSKSPTNYDIVLVADVPASFAEDPHMS
jgi:hypothetical protein